MINLTIFSGTFELWTRKAAEFSALFCGSLVGENVDPHACDVGLAYNVQT